MVSLYQVIYRQLGVEAQVMSIEAESPQQAESRLRAVFGPQGDQLLIQVGPGRPLVEPIGYTVEEACALLHCKERTLRDYQARGELARPAEGAAIFPRHYLESLINKRMGLKSNAA